MKNKSTFNFWGYHFGVILGCILFLPLLLFVFSIVNTSIVILLAYITAITLGIIKLQFDIMIRKYNISKRPILTLGEFISSLVITMSYSIIAGFAIWYAQLTSDILGWLMAIVIFVSIMSYIYLYFTHKSRGLLRRLRK